jgi:hypothetical protein
MRELRAAPHSAPGADEVQVVFDRHLDVIEASEMATALSAAFTPGNNLARSMFLNPETKTSLKDWEDSAEQVAEMLRRRLRRHGRDPRYDDLVGELGARSTQFVASWANGDVEPRSRGVAVFFHPIAGLQNFEYILHEEPAGLTVMRWLPADAAARTAMRELSERGQDSGSSSAR